MPGAARGERAPGATSPRSAGVAGRRARARWDRLLEVRREVVTKALEEARAAQAHRQRPRGARAYRAARPRTCRPCCGPSGRCCRRSSSSPRSSWCPGPPGPVHTRARTMPGLVHRRRPRGRREVRALLDRAARRRRRRRASRAVRALRGRRRRVIVVLGCCAGAVVVVARPADQVRSPRRDLPLGRADHRDRRFFSLTLVLQPRRWPSACSAACPEWRWLVAALSLVALAVLAPVALRVLPDGGRPGRLGASG